MKIYYINCDQSTVRRDWMESQLSQLANDKIQYERISAVEGVTLTEAEINAVTNYDKGTNRELSANEVGCFLSHRKVWQRISDSPDEYGVVMEDDILLSSKVDLFLSNSNWIPTGTAFIRLEVTNDLEFRLLQRHRKGTIGDVKYELFKFTGGGICTGAYVIHKEFAKWLLLHYAKFSIPVDHGLIDPNLFDNGVPTQLPEPLRLQIAPAVIVQQQFSKNSFLPLGAELSSIEPRRQMLQMYASANSKSEPDNKNSPSVLRKITREILRIFSIKHWKRFYFSLVGPKITFLE